MGNFKRIETGIPGLCLVEPTIYGDHRGFFLEFYSKREFHEIELDVEFVQDNHSMSHKGVLRGLHFQYPHTQGKLVRALHGGVYDVVVDLRKGSPTYGQHHGQELTEKNKLMLYAPPGFAHGFVTLEDNTEFMYKVTDYYAPSSDSGIIWNDPDLAIDWKLEKYSIGTPDLSEKDNKLQAFADFQTPFKYAG
jgi:dTDP-4-dehydrorhamnose 3,5-epimerase/reductase